MKTLETNSPESTPNLEHSLGSLILRESSDGSMSIWDNSTQQRLVCGTCSKKQSLLSCLNTVAGAPLRSVARRRNLRGKNQEASQLTTERERDEELRLFEAHIETLCREHSIYRKVQSRRGFAKVPQRLISHQPINDEMAYFVALHEIGHIMVGLSNPSRLEREGNAWLWALQNARKQPHYSVKQRISSLLVRYVYRAEENDWPNPPEDHVFWEILRWWEKKSWRFPDKKVELANGN